jgi:hypothetical protein
MHTSRAPDPSAPPSASLGAAAHQGFDRLRSVLAHRLATLRVVGASPCDLISCLISQGIVRR